MQDDQSQITKVPKPGTSDIVQFNIDVIPRKDITYERLEKGGEIPEGWLMYGNNYRRHHHTTAETITPENVSDLQREWVINEFEGAQEETGGQGSPLVIPGDPPIMYHTQAPQTVRAINARNGNILWRYRYNTRSGVQQDDPSASRGVAVHGDTVYYSTLDFGMVALNRYTADEKWYYNGAWEYRGDTVEDIKWEAWDGGNDPDTAMHPELAYVTDRGSSSAYPPIVHNGVILKGSFGGEMGVSGWAVGIPTADRLSELDLNTPSPTPGETPEAQGAEPVGGNDTAMENDTAGVETEAPGQDTTTPTTVEGNATPQETPEAQGAEPVGENDTAAGNDTAGVETEAPGQDTATPTPQETPTPGEQPEAHGGQHNNAVWELNTTPPDDWVADSWKHGGATVWQAPALDIETGRAVIPTANPGPWFGTVRPGWNPYSAGKVALDYQSGEFAWDYQEVPHDWWDYDSPSPALIYDAEVRGKQRTLASWPGKTPWVFTVDVETGQLITRSDPFVETLNMFDLPVRKSEGFDAAEWIMPNLIGGTDPQPSSFDPELRTMVVKGSNQPMKMVWEPIEYQVAQDYVGMDTIDAAAEQRPQIDGWNKPVGNLTALDPVTGEIKWQNWYDNLLWGGVMTTATGVTFAGLADRTFRAWDTETGEELFKDELDAGVDGNPISWYDPTTNKQYVSVKAGGSRGGGGFETVTYSMKADGGGGAAAGGGDGGGGNQTAGGNQTTGGGA